MTKDVYRPLIRRGPETADVEIYQWDGLHDRWDEQPSGFAPYELARLAKDSGGIYFLLPSEEFMRVRQREQAYSIAHAQGVPARLRQPPDLHPEADADSTLRRRPLRRSSQETQRLPLPPPLPDRPRRARPGRGRGGGEGHRQAERPARDPGAARASSSKLRDREPEKRWQAHYDLMLAQIVAFQVKAYEYRAPDGRDRRASPPPRASSRRPTWRSPSSSTTPQKPLAPQDRDRQEVRRGRAPAQATSSPSTPRPPGPTSPRTPSTAASASILNEWHHNPKYADRAQFVPKY